MRKEPRSVQLHFVVSGLEAELIKERMAELGITNLSAYLRKMAVDGYIVHLDMSEIRKLTRLCASAPITSISMQSERTKAEMSMPRI